MKKIKLEDPKTWKSIGVILVFAAIIWLGNAFVTEVVETIGSNSGKNLPIYCVDTGGVKKMSISFDAAWGNEDTALILDILDQYNVKATFFLVGGWVDKYPEDVKEIYERGHDIGNHSDTHPDMAKLSADEIKKELYNSHKKIQDLIGVSMDLFRPPFGAYNEKLLDTAMECGYYTIQWDVDSLDWKEYGVEDEIDRVLNHKHLGNGSIILFHNNTLYTPDALPAIIEGLQSQGYTLVPISELINLGDYKIDHEGRQIPVGEVKKKEDELDKMVEY